MTEARKMIKRHQFNTIHTHIKCFRMSLKTHRRRKVKNIGGAKGGPNSQQAHDVVLTSMRRNDVASTSFRCHVPTRLLINQCQIITFFILKSDNIENSNIERNSF